MIDCPLSLYFPTSLGKLFSRFLIWDGIFPCLLSRALFRFAFAALPSMSCNTSFRRETVERSSVKIMQFTLDQRTLAKRSAATSHILQIRKGFVHRTNPRISLNPSKNRVFRGIEFAELTDSDLEWRMAELTPINTPKKVGWSTTLFFPCKTGRVGQTSLMQIVFFIRFSQ